MSGTLRQNRWRRINDGGRSNTSAANERSDRKRTHQLRRNGCEDRKAPHRLNDEAAISDRAAVKDSRITGWQCACERSGSGDNIEKLRGIAGDAEYLTDSRGSTADARRCAGRPTRDRISG